MRNGEGRSKYWRASAMGLLRGSETRKGNETRLREPSDASARERSFSIGLPMRHPGHGWPGSRAMDGNQRHWIRSEEHTSELQSPVHLVCRLLLEKKKK